MRKTMRFAALFLALLMVLPVMGSVIQAQDEVVMVIGWEQEPDLPSPLSNSAFAVYLANFYGRWVWDWVGTERTITPFMVEEIPTLENGLVTTTKVMYDDDGDPNTPDVEGDAPVVTYKLHQGMLWSDGQPITADDCMFYHNIMMQPTPLDSWQRGDYPNVVASAEKVDDYTVVVTYNKPFPDYLIDSPNYMDCAYPAHKFLGDNGEGFTMDTDGDGVFDNNVDNAPYFKGFQPGELVGYGPYMLTAYEPGQSATWSRNPNWGVNPWEKVPAIDTIITQWILESEQMENAMEVGDIDMAYNFDAVNNGYGEMANVEKFVTPGVYVDALWMNSGPYAFPAMQDVRVREALVMAIDRRGIAEQFAGEGGGASLTRAWVPAAFTPTDLPFREYDQEKARQMLTEAGWVDADGDEGPDNPAPSPRVSQGVEGVEDGMEFILRFYTTPVIPRPDIQTVMQAQLAQVGVRTQLFVVNGPTILFASRNERGVLNNGDYDLAMYALSNVPLSPNGSADNFRCAGIPSAENPEGRNGTWFCSPEYDRLDLLVSITIDPVKRLEYRFEAEPYFYAAAVWHSVRPRNQWYAVRSDRWNVDSMKDMGTLSNNYFNRAEYWLPLGM